MNPQELFQCWHDRLWRSHYAHNLAAIQYEKLNRGFGVASAVLSTVVGTSLFSTLEMAEGIKFKVVVGLLSIGAAVLASLNAFLSYAELAARHKAVAAKYSGLKIHMEQVMTFPPPVDKTGEVIESICTQWSIINEDSPIVPERIWKQADRKVKVKYPRGESKHHDHAVIRN